MRVFIPRFFIITALFVFICSIFEANSGVMYKIKDRPFLVILLPKHGSILCEGKSYVIRWKARDIRKLCIELLIGGHPAGILGKCNIDALRGKFIWRIPRGFVSGFGVNNAKVRLYLCNKKETYCKFVDIIVKSICVNPIRIKPRPLE